MNFFHIFIIISYFYLLQIGCLVARPPLLLLPVAHPPLEGGFGARLDDLVHEGPVRVERLVTLKALSAHVAGERRLAGVLSLMNPQRCLVPGNHFSSNWIEFSIFKKGLHANTVFGRGYSPGFEFLHFILLNHHLLNFKFPHRK